MINHCMLGGIEIVATRTLNLRFAENDISIDCDIENLNLLV